jgi:hypothetical protein
MQLEPYEYGLTILKTEAACFLVTSVSAYKTIRHYNAEHLDENRKNCVRYLLTFLHSPVL